jgi:hypothetical protein
VGLCIETADGARLGQPQQRHRGGGEKDREQAQSGERLASQTMAITMAKIELVSRNADAGATGAWLQTHRISR